MDAPRFDALTRTIAQARTASRSRRQIVAAAAAAALIAALGRPVPVRAVSFCTELGTGKGCRNSGQCCSHRCKKKHGKHKGKCQCSKLGKPCFEDDDCCGRKNLDPSSPFCEFKSGLTVAVCCKIKSGSCDTDVDCCSNLVCGGTNQCVDPT